MPTHTETQTDRAPRDLLVGQGAEVLAMGDRVTALSRYRAALEQDPDDDSLRTITAYLEAEIGDPRKAAVDLADSIRRRPAHPEAWNLLGVLFRDSGDPEAARSCFRNALALAPRLKAARQNQRKLRSTRRPKGTSSLLEQETRRGLLARRPVRLTVCLIARDEEEMLPDCLDSIAEVADEVVLVDTGSKDRTCAIARDRGARVFSHIWRDDFSAARNEALQHARGDWVLMVDADERLRPEDAPALRAFLQRGAADYAHVAIDSITSGESLATRAIRLFRNYPGLRYVGRVHEQILPALQDVGKRFPLREGEAPVRLRHLGYDTAVFTRRNKAERNRALVEAEVKDNPENAYARLKQGELLFGQGRFAEAARDIEEAWLQTWAAVDAGGSRHLLEEPATLRAACAVGEGSYETALESVQRFHEVLSPTANTSYLEGVALWALGRPGARERILAAIESKDRSREMFTLPEIGGATPRFVLGSIALEERSLPEARARFEESLSFDPSHREARLGLAETLFLEGQHGQALRCLAQRLEADPKDLGAWQLGAVYLVSSAGQEAAARAWLDAGCATFPEDPVLKRLEADLSTRAPRALVPVG